MRRISGGLLTVIAVLATCAVGALMLLFGVAALRQWSVQAVLTSSMEPSVRKGSLTVVVPTNPHNIEPGVVIAFRDPLRAERTVVHRVAEVKHYGDQLMFRTKGDANRFADAELVPPTDVIGRAGWSVPYLGRGLSFLGSPAGALPLLGFPLAAIVCGRLLRTTRRRPDPTKDRCAVPVVYARLPVVAGPTPSCVRAVSVDTDHVLH